MVGGACGSDGAHRRRTVEGGSDENVGEGNQEQGSPIPQAVAPNREQSAKQQHTPKPARVSSGRKEGTPEPSPPAAGLRQSKQAAVMLLLRRPEGGTVGEVVSATGWQPHTVRGLFSGTLKKKLGLRLGSVQEDRGRVYRILDAGDAGKKARSSA
jgi:hypothetical protein